MNLNITGQYQTNDIQDNNTSMIPNQQFGNYQSSSNSQNVSTMYASNMCVSGPAGNVSMFNSAPTNQMAAFAGGEQQQQQHMSNMLMMNQAMLNTMSQMVGTISQISIPQLSNNQCNQNNKLLTNSKGFNEIWIWD